jgi:hypothetical protein
MKLAAWISGLTLAAALAGCGSAPASAGRHTDDRATASASAARNAEGRVIGTFIRVGGPIGAGGTQPPDRHLAGTVQFLAGHHRTFAVRVGKSGKFAVWLPAGTYRVSGRSPSILEVLASGAAREATCSHQQQVAVVAGRALRITVTCIVP